MSAGTVSLNRGKRGRRAMRGPRPTHRRIRTVIVDDSPVVVKSLERFFKERDGFDVVGFAGTGTEAVREAGRLKPDLVVMDIRMPKMDGLEATRRIKAGKGAPVVIVFTLENNLAARTAAKEAGADDFVAKAPNVYRALEGALGRAFPRVKAERHGAGKAA